MLLFVAFVLTAFVLLIALVVYVDPFFHYHKPLKNFNYVVDNQLTQNPGMAEHLPYDSVILGSSMTVNFETDWFEELMGLKTAKLSYSGAFPKDQSNIMKLIFDSRWNGEKREVKKVFLGVDVITYTGDVEQTKYPIPEYLYDNNLLNDVQYVLNKDVLLQYVLRPMADPEPTNWSHIYASWWTEEYYNEDWVLRNYEQPKKVETETPKDEYVTPVEANLSANICPYIEANPDTEFVIFFPPYSILYWNDVLEENHLEATLEEYRYITERLNAYDNVTVYFFPACEDIICDLNHYADYSHYHPKFNRFMTECFASGSYRVSKEKETETAGQTALRNAEENLQKTNEQPEEKTIDEYLEEMRQIVDHYDFDTLHEKIEVWNQ